MKIEVETFEPFAAQQPYLVRGYDDVYWCADIESVVNVVRNELERQRVGA